MDELVLEVTDNLTFVFDGDGMLIKKNGLSIRLTEKELKILHRKNASLKDELTRQFLDKLNSMGLGDEF